MKRLLAILILASACTGTEDIPFETNESILVVEGWLTDQFERQYIKLSRTVPFTSTQQNDVITDAVIEVYEYEGISVTRSFQYFYDTNGFYRTENAVQGVHGRQYAVRIIMNNGEIIFSIQEEMQRVTDITSLTYNSFIRESEEDPNIELTIYYPVAETTDPPDQRNFYRWKTYRNDTLFSDPEDIFLVDDRFIDSSEPYKQEFISFEYAMNDTIKLERVAISQQAFDFLTQLKDQTASLGTNTAVAPAAINGNLYYENKSSRVLGYFGPAAITRGELVVTVE